MTGRELARGVPSPVAVLVTAAVPFVLASRPGAVPIVWVALPLALVAGAARSGSAVARSASAPDGPRRSASPALRRVAAWALAAALAESAWTYVLERGSAGMEVAANPVVALAVVGAWCGGWALTLRAREVVEQRRSSDRPRGPLLAVVALSLAAAGWINAGAASGQRVGIGLAAMACLAVAGGYLQQVKRLGLAAAWSASGRRVDPGVTPVWSAWVAGAFGLLVALTLLWWSPPVTSVRTATEEAPRRVAAALLDRFTPASENTRGGDGEFHSWLDEDAVDEGGEGGGAGWIAGLVALVLALVAGRRVRTSRRGGAPREAWLAGVRRLLQGFASLLAMLRGGHAPAPDASAEQAPRRTRRRRAWRRPSDPRGQVVHDYLRTLDRAATAGLGRVPSQSPSAYAVTLLEHVPEEAASIEGLTQHFIEARYSARPIAPAAAETTRSARRALSTALRRRAPSA